MRCISSDRRYRDLYSRLSPISARTTSGPLVPDYMDYGIQLGRRFRALKAWMVFRAFGRSGIESRIRENCRLAAVFAGLVEAAANFTIAAPLSMAIVCFRFDVAGIEGEAANLLNQQVVERVNATGRAYLTFSSLRGRTVMRAGFGNVLTTEAEVIGVWDVIREEAQRLFGETP